VETIKLVDIEFAVTVSWAAKPKSKTRESLTYTLDMRVYRERSIFGELDPTTDIARSLENIQ
jgi:hypothetical protein